MADDDPTEQGATPEAEPVPDGLRPLSSSDPGASVGDVAADVADALLTDDATVADALTDHDGPGQVHLEAPVRPATRKRSGKSVEASPLLTVPRAAAPEAIALFVHGGDVTSYIPARRGDPAYLRIVPFARDLERRSGGRVGGAMLRLSMRGWNDPDLPALDDTRWALETLRRQYPGVPLALVGHSMGGRVVLHLGDSADVDAIVALAPWAADEYDAEVLEHTPLLVVHGRRDTVTDPKASEDLVARIDALGGEARFVSMPGWHAMLWRAQAWHKASSTFLVEHLLTPEN